MESHAYQKTKQQNLHRQPTVGFCDAHSCAYVPSQGCWFCHVGAKAVEGKNVWKVYPKIENEEAKEQ